MATSITKFERNTNWQATAKRRDGREVAVMRGQPSGQYAGKFYLYEEDWTPTPDLSGMTPYSASEIGEMFASGDLLLVRGAIPI